MNLRGTSLVVFLGILVPTALTYLASGAQLGHTFFILACGACAYSLMALNIVIATRLLAIDWLFGGLDRAYFIHKWSGAAVLVLAYIHHEFPILYLAGHRDKVSNFTDATNAIILARFIFWPLVFLIVISLVKRFWKYRYEIPWAWWRWSHRLLPLAFLALWWHYSHVATPFDNRALIVKWLDFCTIIGIASFGVIYLGPLFRRKTYVVTEVRRHLGGTTIDLNPVQGSARITPGSFAFVSFAVPGLREPHPFTVSRVGVAADIQFSIKGLGDFTKRAGRFLEIGDKARVEGGYGRFHFTRGGDKQIWVGAGIGVTPLLAWADHVDAEKDVYLFYCVKNETEALGLQRLQDVCAKRPNVKLLFHQSAVDGHLNAGLIISKLGFDISEASFWFCGPTPMRRALTKSFKQLGKQPKSIHYEKFEFR